MSETIVEKKQRTMEEHKQRHEEFMAIAHKLLETAKPTKKYENIGNNSRLK